MRPFILAYFAHFSVMTKLRDVLQRVCVKVYEKAIPNIEDEQWKQNHKLRQDYTTYTTMMMTTVTLFLSLGTSVLMRVCRRTATSSALRWTSPQRTAATSKLSRGEIEDTLLSPFVFFPGEGVGSLLAMVRRGGGLRENNSAAGD